MWVCCLEILILAFTLFIFSLILRQQKWLEIVFWNEESKLINVFYPFFSIWIKLFARKWKQNKGENLSTSFVFVIPIA